MGIALAMVKLLMRDGKKDPFKGSVITAGKQEIFATFKDITKWAEEMDFPLKSEVKKDLINKGWLKKNENVEDIAFFRLLGFDRIESLDSNDFEKCTIVHDLNQDIPQELHNQFDLIFDGGTSEHIFDFPKVLENYYKLLKVGGRIIHALPASNFVDHGFYMFSPTLFYDYYTANQWDIVDALFFRHSYRHDRRLWDIYNYKPGSLNRHTYGGLNRGLYGTFFVARKKAASIFDASVQQGFYLRAWNNKPEDKKALKLFRALPPGLREVIHYFITRIVPLKYFMKRIARY